MSKWLWRVAARKVSVAVGQLVVAYGGAWGLGKFGVEIDQVQLTAGLFALLEGIRDYLKLKHAKEFKWL